MGIFFRFFFLVFVLFRFITKSDMVQGTNTKWNGMKLTSHTACHTHTHQHVYAQRDYTNYACKYGQKFLCTTRIVHMPAKQADMHTWRMRKREREIQRQVIHKRRKKTIKIWRKKNSLMLKWGKIPSLVSSTSTSVQRKRDSGHQQKIGFIPHTKKKNKNKKFRIWKSRRRRAKNTAQRQLEM